MRRFLHALLWDVFSCRGAYDGGRRAGIQLGVARLSEAAERVSDTLALFDDGLDEEDVMFELRELEGDLVSAALFLDREGPP